MQSTLEHRFLSIYMDGKPYSPEVFREYNMRAWREGRKSLNIIFNELLEEQCNKVSDEDFSNFNSHFTFIKRPNNVTVTQNQDKVDNSCCQILKKPEKGTIIFSRCEVEKEIPAAIALAKEVGSFFSFHIYNWHGLFAGIVNEIFVQLPNEFRNYGKNYFYTCNFIEERYETHYVRITVYEDMT
jgi:hypothetical protein